MTDLLNSGAQVEHQLSKNDQARQIGCQVFFVTPIRGDIRFWRRPTITVLIQQTNGTIKSIFGTATKTVVVMQEY